MGFFDPISPPAISMSMPRTAGTSSYALVSPTREMAPPLTPSAQPSAENRRGELLIFEADNTAVVHNIDSPTLFPYKPPQMTRIFEAFAAMLYRYEQDDPLRECPECGSIVPISDQVCMRCGADLDFPEPIAGAGNPV